MKTWVAEERLDATDLNGNFTEARGWGSLNAFLTVSDYRGMDYLCRL